MLSRHRDVLSHAIAALLFIAGALASLAFGVYTSIIPITDDDTFTMKILDTAMGVSITVAITLIYFLYSKETDQAIESHLRGHRLVPGRDKRSRRAQEARAARSVCVAICSLLRDCSMLTGLGDRSKGVLAPDWLWFRADLVALHAAAARSAHTLAAALWNAYHLGGGIRDDIIAAIDRLEVTVSIDDGKRTVDTTQYQEISGSLNHVLARLGRRLDLAMSQPPRRPGSVGTPDGLAVCLDRDTYPPGAAIRVTIESCGQFPCSEVTVVILDEGLAEVDKRDKRTPVRAPGQTAPDICAVSVIMSPEGLSAGQEYTAHAACGDLSGVAAFAVENVAPTVRADRQACAAGDDIAITVEDPAACAGGAGEEFAGDGKGPRLAVESPDDRIDACRLEEAGAGTFLGRVRCVDARAAGGSDRGDVPGGGRTECDSIACGPNQLIRIRYERGDEEAWTAVLVEEPDAGVPDPAYVAGAARRPACAGIDGGRGGGGAGPVTPCGRMRGGSEDGGRGQWRTPLPPPPPAPPGRRPPSPPYSHAAICAALVPRPHNARPRPSVGSRLPARCTGRRASPHRTRPCPSGGALP